VEVVCGDLLEGLHGAVARGEEGGGAEVAGTAAGAAGGGEGGGDGEGEDVQGDGDAGAADEGLERADEEVLVLFVGAAVGLELDAEPPEERAVARKVDGPGLVAGEPGGVPVLGSAARGVPGRSAAGGAGGGERVERDRVAVAELVEKSVLRVEDAAALLVGLVADTQDAGVDRGGGVVVCFVPLLGGETAAAGAARDGAGYVGPDLTDLDGFVGDEEMTKDVFADLGGNGAEVISGEAAGGGLGFLFGRGLCLGARRQLILGCGRRMTLGSCDDPLGCQLVPCRGRRLGLGSLEEVLGSLFQFFLKSLLDVLLEDIHILGLVDHFLNGLLDILLEWMLGAVLSRADREVAGLIGSPQTTVSVPLGTQLSLLGRWMNGILGMPGRLLEKPTSDRQVIMSILLDVRIDGLLKKPLGWLGGILDSLLPVRGAFGLNCLLRSSQGV